MSRWIIDSPTTLDFDGVVALRVRIVAGSVAVLATADRPRIEVNEVSGQPLLVTHEAGILTVSYEDLTWEGLRGWLRPKRHSANITIMVQKDCPTQLGVVNATAIVSGVSARTSLKSVSGDMTLDGVTGAVDANTVSGNIEAQGLEGHVIFRSVSGDLTLADGCVGRLDARTVNGGLTADVALAPTGEMRVTTLSGDVAIRLPAGTDARVDLRSASGQMRSDFDPLTSAGDPGSKTMAGTLGGGSGKLSVSTMSGDVTILQGSQREGPCDAAASGPEETAAAGSAETATTSPAKTATTSPADAAAYGRAETAKASPADAAAADPETAVMGTGGSTKEGEAR
jgi:hypothetical protein